MELLEFHDQKLYTFLQDIVINKRTKLYNKDSDEITLGGNHYKFQEIRHKGNMYQYFFCYKGSFDNELFDSPSKYVFDINGNNPNDVIVGAVMSKSNIIN